jgi:hypothetical protein
MMVPADNSSATPRRWLLESWGKFIPVKGKAQRPIEAYGGVEDHHEEIEALGCKPL